MTKNVLLIDVDSIMPNLAQTQISRHHKLRGDEVSLNNPNEPGIVYISCVFKENRKLALGRATLYPDAEVYVGGSGINYSWLPEEIQKQYPDYSLYNGKVCQKCAHLVNYCKCRHGPTPGDIFYSLGFTTRGCIRYCPFCIVHEKEGGIMRWQHITDFFNPEYGTIILLDNNIFADREWFFINTDFILQHNLKWNPIQGMDIRLLDLEIAERLADLKWYGTMYFAFDNMRDEPAVRSGIEILKEAGIDIKHDVQIYVLVGYGSSQEEDKYRCRLLKSLGTNAFVMPYERNDWTNKLAWWANRKHVYWACDIDEFEYSKYYAIRKSKNHKTIPTAQKVL